MRRLALVGCVLVVAAGCGGGGGGLSKDEYVSRLDDICADFNAKQDEIGEPQSLEDVAEKGPQIQDEFAAAIERIRDLGEPPDEIADDANRFLELADQSRDLIEDIVAAAKDNDLAEAQRVAERGQGLEQESDRIATDLGAPSCAQD